MRVMVLGGTRFIGRALVAALLEDGHDVAVVHRGAAAGGGDAGVPSGVDELLLDRNDIAAHAPELAGWRPEVVVDMFAMTRASARAALEAIAGDVRRWVVASSMDVYRAYDHLQGREDGPPLEGALTEDSPLRRHLYPYRGSGRESAFPIDDYEKIEVEHAVLEWPNLEAVALRLPAVYGPRDAQHRLARDLAAMDRGDATLTLGASEAAWRFAMGYVEDIGRALALTATHPAAEGVYHVAEQDTRTRQDLVTALGEEAGWSGTTEVVPDEQIAPDRRAPIDYRQQMAADSSRIRRELGYAERVPFRAALRRTIAWERETRAAEE